MNAPPPAVTTISRTTSWTAAARCCILAAISPGVRGGPIPGLRPGIATVRPQEGQAISWPGVDPGMKKFHAQPQVSAILDMKDDPFPAGFRVELVYHLRPEMPDGRRNGGTERGAASV